MAIMDRHVPLSSVNRVFAAFTVIAALVAVAPSAVLGADDSLRSALEAISDKIGETPPRVVYLSPDDGQPEDIGYGYQRNFKNLDNIFEPTASNKFSKDEMVLKFLNYLAKENPAQQYNKKPWSKKSIFREREDSDMPDNLQQLKYDRYAMPSAFRERYKTNPPTAQDYNGDAEDQDEYLYAVNALVDKYLENNLQGVSDKELEDFLRSQQEKRNVPEEYQSPYEPGYNKRAGNPTDRQYLIIPQFPRYQGNKFNKHRNRWMKPRLIKRSKIYKYSSTNGTHTDPKVAAELNNIFLGSEPNGSSNDNNSTTSANDSVNKTSKLADDSNNAKIALKKKSTDWSNYFGYDRRKKSIESIPSDDTILNQYMRTYGKESEDNEANAINNLKNERLVWLEDVLIDDALKYTGANQGVNDPDEINNVKNQVLSNLNQAYNIEKLIQDKAKQENNEMIEKQYEKSDFVNTIVPRENNSQPINSLDTAEPHNEDNHKECTQLMQITQDCLDLGGSAGELMLPVCTLYRVCRTCESEQTVCERRFVQGSHELCSRAPLCRYFARRMLQLMQDHPLQMECHKCMINFLQNED